MKRKYWIFLIFISLVSSVWAQNFTANADRRNVGIGDIIHLTYTLNGGNGSDFSPPPFNGFNVLGGPDVSNQFNSYNGQVSVSMSISYALQASKKGKITIAPASILYRGSRIASNAVTIIVDKHGPANSANAVANPDNGRNLFLKATAEKNNVYEGQGVSVTYKLYVAHNVRMGSPTVTKMPNFTGFWSEDGNTSQRLVQSEETYKGKEYAVYTIRKLILFPQKTGDLTVDPLEMECDGQMVTSKKADPYDPFSNMFDDFFNTNTVPFHKIVASNPVEITVKPLPDKGKPASFSGMVGKAAISASIDHHSVKANEPVICHVTIGGEGNLSLQQPLKLNLPQGIEEYEPKTTDKFNKTGDNLTGTRTFEYTLMPHKAGLFNIPAIPFSYFDPVQKTYVETQTSPITLQVEANPEAQKQADIENKKNDSKPDSSISPEIIKWGIFSGAAIVLAFFVVLFIRKRPQAIENEMAEDPFDKKDYAEYLDEAKSKLENDPQSSFYTVMLNALYGFMDHYLDIPFAQLNHESIRDGLAQKNITEHRIADYLRLIEECEMVQYAPTGFTSNKQDVFVRGSELIRDLKNLPG